MKKPKEPKEPKEKKPKKQKAPKEKKPKKPKKGQPPAEGQEDQEGKKGKKGKKKLILILIPLIVVIAVVVVVVFVILPGKSSDDDPDAEVSVEPLPPSLPPEYQVGDETVDGMTLGSEESEAKSRLTKVVYTYTDLADAGKAAETYVTQLAAANPKFYVVDEEYVRTDRPDFTASEGTVLMARNIVIETQTPSPAPEGSQEGGEEQEGEEESAQPSPSPTPTPAPVEQPSMVLAVKIEWSKGQCIVTTNEAEGTVTSPQTQSSNGGGGGMGQQAAKDYLNSLTPAQLGLSGQSMDEYEIMTIDGTVYVNDLPCNRLNIYDKNDVIMGCFLITLDGQHLYRLDPDTNQATAMEMPKVN